MATMIGDPPTSRSLGVGFSSNRGRTANSEAWKQNIGTRQVPARLALLPDAKPNWRRVGFSAAVQLTFLGFLLIVPMLYPEQMKTAIQYSYTAIAQPVTMIPVAPPPPPPPPPPKVKAVVPKPTPPPPEPPKLNPQQPHIFANLVAPKALKPKVEKAEIKDPDMSPKFEAVKIDVKENGPKRPKEDVKVNNLNSGSAAPATVVAPVEKVQTGGFGAQELTKGNMPTRQVEVGPATSSVEVTFKPNPVYTDEARQLRLQGEVLLEVMFGANGQLHVNRVVRGLGHGLDEAAMAAASKMRFKPALRSGVPVDSTAVVHVVFQLAY